jgi:hypothetical protein
MRVDIAGIEKLKKTAVSKAGHNFILLFDNPHLEERLTVLLEDTTEVRDLLHFCCYGKNRNFFIHLVPRKESLVPLLEGIYRHLPSMMKQKSRK